MNILQKLFKAKSYYGLTKAGDNLVKYNGPLEELGLDGKLAGDIIEKVIKKAPSIHLLLVPQLGLIISIRSARDFSAFHLKSRINENVTAAITSSLAQKGRQIRFVENFGAIEIV